MFGFFKNSGTPNVRRIGASEAVACAKIHAPAFAHPWSASEFESLLCDQSCLADGAYLGARAKLTGFCLSRRAADEAEILSIAVASDARRGGVGKALLATHLARLAGCGTKVLFLEVESGNLPAIGLYQHFGFVEVGQRPAYTRMKDGSLANALIMRRDLT